MVYRILIALLGASLLMAACSDDEHVNGPSQTIYGSGDFITETRQLPEFKSIVVNTVAYVNLTRGANQEVMVTCDDNIIEYIATPVYDGVLYISVQQGVPISDFTLELNLTVTDLESIIVNSVATVQGNGSFDVDYLVFEMNSVGNIDIDLNAYEVFSVNSSVGTIILSGSATRHNAAVTSVGSLQAFELETDTTFVTANSIGNAQVNANIYLHATINSTGSIYYRGYPEIQFIDNGTGRLINAN
jgi:hypothetical protein